MSPTASILLEALAPGILVIGALLVALPWLSPRDERARTVMVVVLVVLMWRYMFWRWFATLPMTGLRLDHQRVLTLELLLGQRVGEICGMRKRELNLDERLWFIPGVRTKNGRDHVCPLPPEARMAPSRVRVSSMSSSIASSPRQSERGKSFSGLITGKARKFPCGAPGATFFYVDNQIQRFPVAFSQGRRVLTWFRALCIIS